MNSYFSRAKPTSIYQKVKKKYKRAAASSLSNYQDKKLRQTTSIKQTAIAPKIQYKKDSVKRGPAKRKNYCQDEDDNSSMMSVIKNHMPGGWTIGGNVNS